MSKIVAPRGIEVSREAVRDPEAKLLPVIGDALRKHRHSTPRRCGMSRHIDDTDLKIHGCRNHLYRAFDRTAA